MNRVRSALLGAFALAGCAEPTPTVEWLSPDDHFRLVGVNEGVPVDAFSDDPLLLGLGRFHCERTYFVPLVSGVPDESQARLTAIDISITNRPVDRLVRLAMAVRREDLASDPLETPLGIVPLREGMEPMGDETILELSLTDVLLDEEYLRAAAKAGNVTLHLLSGTPPSGSRIVPPGDGYVGLTFDIVFHPEGYFRGSFTAPCTINHVVTEAP